MNPAIDPVIEVPIEKGTADTDDRQQFAYHAHSRSIFRCLQLKAAETYIRARYVEEIFFATSTSRSVTLPPKS